MSNPEEPYNEANTHKAVIEKLRALSGRGCVLPANRATLALVALFKALHLPKGSEVLLPVTLCANPAYAVRWAGLTPLFADIDPTTLLMDLRSAEEAVGPRTRVLLAVPLFGYPLETARTAAFAREHNLLLIEDAAHAVGVRYSDMPAGKLGLASVYSFGRGKIADAGGGAAVLSDDPALMDRVEAGLDMRSPLDWAVVGRALDGLPEELQGRRDAASMLRRVFGSFGSADLMLPVPAEDRPLWKYSVLARDRAERDRLTRNLLRVGIEAPNLYPPLSLYFPEARNARARFPAASSVFSKVVNLPVWPTPSDFEVKVRGALGG